MSWEDHIDQNRVLRGKVDWEVFAKLIRVYDAPGSWIDNLEKEELRESEYDALYPAPIYREYITSSYWRSKSNALKEARGGKCELCGSTNKLETHHLSYRHLGYELPQELQVLCSECHSKAHGEK